MVVDPAGNQLQALASMSWEVVVESSDIGSSRPQGHTNEHHPQCRNDTGSAAVTDFRNVEMEYIRDKGHAQDGKVNIYMRTLNTAVTGRMDEEEETDPKVIVGSANEPCSVTDGEPASREDLGSDTDLKYASGCSLEADTDLKLTDTLSSVQIGAFSSTSDGKDSLRPTDLLGLTASPDQGIFGI